MRLYILTGVFALAAAVPHDNHNDYDNHHNNPWDWRHCKYVH